MRDSEEEFLALGEEIVADLRGLADLGPDSFVVDIGSGYGRAAHALLRWSGFRGTYLGIEILERHVRWCAENLAPPSGGRFSFRHLDVRNTRYNPNGALDPARVDFGVPDGSADVILLRSVFTHMYPAPIRHYLRCIRRMLRPQGRCLATLFLMNDSWRLLEGRGRSEFPLAQQLTPYCRFMDPLNPLHVVAYEESWFLDQLARAGLWPTRPIRLGRWCGRETGVGLQDAVVFARVETTVEP